MFFAKEGVKRNRVMIDTQNVFVVHTEYRYHIVTYHLSHHMTSHVVICSATQWLLYVQTHPLLSSVAQNGFDFFLVILKA